jgi:RHS repeat-associated protein
MAINQNKEGSKEHSTPASGGQISPPSITLPKGGGAIRGIGEKFAANPVTGTGSMTVPIATSPGRSGFGPQLSLTYDSGSGNGPFGFGWSLSLPSITRKTDKGLPRYLDGQQEEPDSDEFILSGAEDLVPEFEKDANGNWVLKDGKHVIHEKPRTVNGVTYNVRRYRPRIEGLFARIERWTNQSDPTDVSWRSISKDNITTWYGRTENSRIVDPADKTRIFRWLICQSYDDKGNAIVYEYEKENTNGVDTTQAHENNRTNNTRSANRYLKRIKYGNLKPNRNLATWQATDPTELKDWLLEVVFDYGEGHYEEMPLDPSKTETEQHQYVLASKDGQKDNTGQPLWPARQDPFSAYRAGFEVRTYRLCRRALMFHHFRQELGIDDCLVRSTEFTYRQSPVASFITSITQSGFVHQPDGNYQNRYLKKSLPPLEFGYSQVPTSDELARLPIREVDAKSLENLPVGLDGTTYQWVDLDGEGISGILTEQAGAWFYKRNLSALPPRDAAGVKQPAAARFGTIETIAARPATTLAGGHAQFMDLAGDGRLDLVQMEGPIRGFYERTDDANWESFRPFTSWPNVDIRDPNLKFIDLNGDGHADIIVTEDDVLTWYPSLAEEGFGEALHVPKVLDEEKGPRLVFADGTHSIYLADLSGDGLTDVVRIRNGGEVCYWPNLGYGRFGAKVTMDNSPWFDRPDQFDQSRIRLADIDGSGTTDIIYLRNDGVQIYFNQSGNHWSNRVPLPQFPQVDNLSSVQTLDLLGNGTACMVWSSSLPSNSRRPMFYVALMPEKPHLLTKTVNNLGAETIVQYVSSTKFYLKDKEDGKPWITKLPFPLHVVERVETYDHISRNRFVTRYSYHHGYFDGEEREFRGFGRVEQWDTEQFAIFEANGLLKDADNLDKASHVPPVLTKTWFHTGAYIEGEKISRHFEDEYYREPGLSPGDAEKLLLDDTVHPGELSPEEERESSRALKGSMLRQEVYALDGTVEAEHPYTVTEQNFTIRKLQPRGSNRHGVFFTNARESISYHYEREPADPRVGHALTLEVDGYGNVLKSAAIGYGRRHRDANLSPADQAKQAKILITYTENRVTKDHDSGNDAIDQDNDYRTPLPSESRTYELTDVIEWQRDYPKALEEYFRPKGRDRFTFDEILKAATTAIELDYEKNPTPGRLEKRLIEHVRSYYRRNDLTASLPLGELQSLALPFESYKLAFTPGLAAEMFGGRVSADMLDGTGATPGGCYVHSEGDVNWWIPSGKIFYSLAPADLPAQELAYARQHFFLPHRYRDPFHTDAVSTESFVTYDTYDLLVQETRDPLGVVLGNRVTVGERNVDPTQPLLRRAQNYRVLQPALVMDPNRNRSAVAFDALGMVVGTAVMGKPEEAPNVPGDRLTATFRPDLTQAEIDQFLANPKGPIAATLLDDATTRVVYDLTAYWREPNPAKKPPAVAATLARETHASEPVPAGGLRIQASLSYSDGFGREIQKKIQAEPGPVPTRDAAGKIIVGADGQPVQTPNEVSPRWVGSGWTVFNNKGKPVRQYEPFFTDTHRFEFDVRIGVSPVLFYDPVERVVATLHPNHTWEKVVFDPWRQETWDVNDTVLVADPKSDADVGDFFGRLADTEYLPSWRALRTQPAHAAAAAQRWPDPKTRDAERRAAEKASVHAATPTIAHADSLGRTFLTIAHNKFKYSDTPPAAPPVEEFHHTHIVLDIEGNQREVVDAKDRVVMRYDYDMLGNRVHQASMEAGERWMLNDVAGKPLYAWDSRDHRFRTAYDPLRRPTDSFLREGAGAEIIVGRSIYGETRPNPDASNLRGKVVELRDQAGVVTSDLYDFKGNLLRSQRQLAQSYKTTLDWSGVVPLQAETFASRTRYDALNRPTQLIAPHSDQPGTKVNVIQPSYNEANLLEQVHAWLNRNAEPAGWLDPATATLHAVTDIDYDAKGQRTRIDHGTQDGKVIRTSYAYDRETFRLTHLYTRRGVDPLTAQGVSFTDDCDNPQPPPPTITAPEDPPQGKSCGLQNLHYAYDPAGNITHIRDDAQQTIYFKNKRVEPSTEYTYDAIYRLIEATGREHLGQVGGPPIPHSYNDVPRVGLLHPGDGNAMGRYLERYVYDEVGNFLSMQHRGTDPANPGWNRAYAYTEPSSLEPGRHSNRLTSTTIGGTAETYSTLGDGYDAHGNMLRMPHLQVMQWDFNDQLQMTQRQAVNAADTDGVQRQGERTWYVYDSVGRRIRKVTELATGHLKDERIYLGGFEIYYRRSGANAGLVRETLHVMDAKKRIALVETRNDVEDGSSKQLIRYQFSNHLGSASLELDDQAQIISYEEYTPYGSTSYQAVRSQTDTPKRYRYTGKERDEESGFSYHTARYYASWLGRWCSTDPLGLEGGPHLYEYALDSPISFVDASGTQPGSAFLSAGRRTPRHPGEITEEEMRRIEAARPPPPDPLEEAAKLHGRTEGRLQTLQQEIVELYQSRQQGAPIRFWSMEHHFAAAGFPEPITERGREAQEYVEAGLAEAGTDDYWHSTVLERAIENGIISNQADQERFLGISERERRSAVVRWALWRAAEMALALTPVKGSGAGGMLFARAPQSTSAAVTAMNQAARSSGISGAYRNVVESMSQRAIQFQEIVSGGIRAGTSFVRNGVKFDFLDVARRALVDAKGPGYANFVNRQTGEFYGWFAGRQTLVDQARRQLAAARGTTVEWVFAEREAMQAAQRLLQDSGIAGIVMRVH